MKTVLILIMIHTIVGGKTDEKKDEKKDKKEDKKAVVGSITCQNLDGGLAANPLLQVWNPKPLSLVCWDDDENGCENDDDGCLLPKKCEEYKDSFSYSTEGKASARSRSAAPPTWHGPCAPPRPRACFGDEPRHPSGVRSCTASGP